MTWLRAALIRAVRTIAQTAVGTIGAAVALEQVDWPFVASAAGLAGLMSMLTSLAGLPEAAQTGVVGVPDDLPADDLPTTGAPDGGQGIVGGLLAVLLLLLILKLIGVF